MNRIIKTIIVDNNKEAVKSLKEHLNQTNDIKVIATFSNGDDAFNFMINNTGEYDLVLMDILLPGTDGLTILEELNTRHIKKRIIVLSNYKDEDIIESCANQNVSYYMLKPFSFLALERRIKELFKSNITASKINQSIDYEISQLLHNLGIPSHIRGYKYIRDGIIIMYNSEAISLITKDVYPQIAVKYQTTPTRVERSIRHAIEVSWLRGDLSLMEELFGFSVSCEKSKPTNSEFLTTIAERIKMGSYGY